MSKHSVTIGVDGSIRVDHHNDEAPELLQALTVAGGANQVGAGSALPQSMSDLDNMLQEAPQPDQVSVARHTKAQKLYYAAHQVSRENSDRLSTATKVAQAMIHNGNTRGRDPEYIASKAHAIANALHDQSRDRSLPDFDAILAQVIAEDTPEHEQ